MYPLYQFVTFRYQDKNLIIENSKKKKKMVLQKNHLHRIQSLRASWTLILVRKITQSA